MIKRTNKQQLKIDDLVYSISELRETINYRNRAPLFKIDGNVILRFLITVDIVFKIVISYFLLQ